MNPAYRRGLPEDIEEMFHLDQICFSPPFAFSRPHFDHLMNSVDSISVLAHVDGSSLAGFVVLEPIPPDSHCIQTIDIRPEYRRRGIGAELMARAKTLAVDKGLFQSFLQVYVQNFQAIAFYESLGYQIANHLPDYYAPGLDATLMLSHTISAKVSHS